MVDRNLVRLGDVARITAGQSPVGSAISTTPGTVPFFQGSKDFGLKYPEPRTYCDAPPRVAPPGAVLLSVRAPIGRVNRALVASGIGRGVMALSGAPGLLDTDYLEYVLRWFEPQWSAHESSGAVFANLGRSNLEEVRLHLPPLSEQRTVADALGALDAKIESNRRIAALAEQVIIEDLGARWSDSWTRKSVSSLAEFVNGGAYTNGANGAGRMVIRIAELNSGPGPSTVYNDIQVPDNQLARPGDVLMSWSGSLGVYRWVRNEAIINQHIFKVICREYPRWFVFAKLREVLPEFRQIAADKATTMGHIQRHHLDDTVVAVPRPDEIADLDSRFGSLWERLVLAERESLTLAPLRDALIPELLAGRLRIAGTDQTSERPT